MIYLFLVEQGLVQVRVFLLIQSSKVAGVCVCVCMCVFLGLTSSKRKMKYKHRLQLLLSN